MYKLTLLQDMIHQENAETDTESIPPESPTTSYSSQSFKRSIPSNISQPKKRNVAYRNNTSDCSVEKQIQCLKDIVEQNEKKKDQYDAFATHISTQLKELPLRSFIILQGQIQDLINRERLANLPFQQRQQFDSRPSTSASAYSDIGLQPFQQESYQQINSRPSTSNSHYSDFGQQPFQQQGHQQFESRLPTSPECSDLLQQARESALIESDDDYNTI